MKKNSNLNKVLESWRILANLSPFGPLEVVEAEHKLGCYLLRSLSSVDTLYITEYPKKNK